jgi:hypothetical protein
MCKGTFLIRFVGFSYDMYNVDKKEAIGMFHVQ